MHTAALMPLKMHTKQPKAQKQQKISEQTAVMEHVDSSFELDALAHVAAFLQYSWHSQHHRDVLPAEQLQNLLVDPGPVI